MSVVLLVGKAGISEVCKGVARQLSDQAVIDLSAGLKSTSVHVVLDDPAYVSASYPVELRRHERQVMAESRFAELGGEEGVGSWCIAPEGAGFRLYVLALDPSSPERGYLKKLASEGLAIRRISSSLMSSVVECESGDLGLRVVVRDACVQLGLQRHGQWIFARRIEASGEQVKEAVETTLRYLQAQGYLELPFEGTYELVAGDNAQGGLAELWVEPEGILPEPMRKKAIGVSALRPTENSTFNCIGQQQGKPSEQRVSSWLLSSALAVALMLAYVVPQKIIRPIAWPVMVDSRDVDLPEGVQQQFWTRSQIQQWVITAPQTVGEDLTRLLAVLDEQPAVNVQDLSIDSGRSYRVRCSLGGQYVDPLHKREVHLLVRDRVAFSLPSHRVNVQAFDGHSLDSRQAESVFELMLEVPRETQ